MTAMDKYIDFIASMLFFPIPWTTYRASPEALYAREGSL